MKRLFIALGVMACLALMPMYVLAGSVVTGLPEVVKSGIRHITDKKSVGDMKFKFPIYLSETIWTTGAGETTIHDSTTETIELTGEISLLEFVEVDEGDIDTAYTVELINQEGRDVLQGVADCSDEVSATRTANAHSRSPLNAEGDRIRLIKEKCYWKISNAGNSNTGKIRLGLTPIN